MNKLTALKFILVLGAVYYAIGGIAHYFGLTIFPFFVSELYVPYQDSIIALVCLIFVLLLLAVARDPIKNVDTLNVLILGVALASVFSILIIYKIDLASLGAPAKKLQTITEGIMGFIYLGLLLWLHPRRKI